MIFGKQERISTVIKKSNRPGPGSYSAWSKSSKMRNDPAYSLGTSKRTDMTSGTAKRFMPGPGQYDTCKSQEAVSNKRKALSKSMGLKL